MVMKQSLLFLFHQQFAVLAATMEELVILITVAGVHPFGQDLLVVQVRKIQTDRKT